MKALVKVIIVAVCLGVIYHFGSGFLAEKKWREEYNQSVDLINEGKFEVALTQLEALLKRSSDAGQQSMIKSDLARCYRHYSQDPKLSLKQQREYIVKIEKLDPDMLTDMDRKILKLKSTP